MRFVTFLVVLCLVAVASAQKKAPTHGKVVVCATHTKSVRDATNSEFDVKKADWELCTHVLVIDDRFDSKVKDVSEAQRDKDYQELTKLQKKNKHLKIIMSEFAVEVFREFKDISDDAEKVAHFFNSAAEHLKTNNFHGIDLNWQNLEASLKEVAEISKEKTEIQFFLRELKNAFQKQNLLVTFSITVTNKYLDRAVTDFPKYAEFFDLLHLVQPNAVENVEQNTLDFAMKELKSENIKEKVDCLIEWGIPASKIVLGINFGAPTAVTGLSGHVEEAKVVTFAKYGDVCQLLSTDKEFEKESDESKELTVLGRSYAEKRETSFIAYRTTKTIANLAKWAVERELAGALGLAIDWDDFKGKCEIEKNTFEDFDTAKSKELKDAAFPLLHTIHKALKIAVEKIDAQAKPEQGEPEQGPETTANQEPEANEADPSEANDPGKPGAASSFTHNSFFMAVALLGVLFTSVSM